MHKVALIAGALALAACGNAREPESRVDPQTRAELAQLEQSMENLDEMLRHSHDENVERTVCELRTYHNVVYTQVRAEAGLSSQVYNPERFDAVCTRYPDISVREQRKRHESVHPTS